MNAAKTMNRMLPLMSTVLFNALRNVAHDMSPEIFATA